MVMTAAGADGSDNASNASDDDEEQGLAADIEAGRSLVSGIR
jgi:hypothetical protein